MGSNNKEDDTEMVVDEEGDEGNMEDDQIEGRLLFCNTFNCNLFQTKSLKFPTIRFLN